MTGANPISAFMACLQTNRAGQRHFITLTLIGRVGDAAKLIFGPILPPSPAPGSWWDELFPPLIIFGLHPWKFNFPWVAGFGLGRGVSGMSDTYQDGFKDGLRRAEEIAVNTVDDFWNEEFARHGNAGIAKMKQKVGIQIEEAILAERKKSP